MKFFLHGSLSFLGFPIFKVSQILLKSSVETLSSFDSRSEGSCVSVVISLQVSVGVSELVGLTACRLPRQNPGFLSKELLSSGKENHRSFGC